MNPRPTFQPLSPVDAEALLARHHVGRLAYTHDGQVDIEPIHYVHRGEWIFCRTAPGTKLTSLGHQPWVAFEVDEIEGPFDWQSVVAHGTVYPVGDGPADDRARAEALAAIRSFQPEALTAADPVPERTALLRIHLQRLTGRRATTRS
ncbi:MAG: pyridoxamine 5'-phosphate oxidase family protein [Gemmatimonadales bacterium]|jgi:hypothetical protein